MKKTFSILSLLLWLFSCTDFREEFSADYQAHQHLTIDQPEIHTHTAVINIEVDQAEFNHMHENVTEEIEIYGLFQLYREQQLVFESHQTRFKIKGNASRHYEMKTIGIRFEKPENNIARSIFNPKKTLPFHCINKVESLRLRNSGNDFLGERYGTMIKDIAYTQLAIQAGLDIDLMYAEQAIVFINKIFYGLLNLRSETTARAIAGKYSVHPDQISLGKLFNIQTEIVVLEHQNGDYQKIRKLFDAIENNNLNYIKEWVDLPSFIDYVIYQTFIANRDWPHNNVKVYAIDESKFRFIMYDLDNSNTLFANVEPLNFLDLLLKNPVADLFHILYKDDDFRLAFDERYRDLLESGVLSSAAFRSITNRYYKHIETLMPYQIEKYGQPKTLAEWYRNIEILNANFEKREKNVRKFILQ